jgi:hypothetical protein
MAENVIRQDVIQIGFDTDFTNLTKANEGIDELKKSVTGVGKKDGLNDVKESAENLNKSTGKATSSLKALGNVTLTKLNNGIDKIGSSLVNVAKKATGVAYSSLKKVAGLSFKGLTVGIAGISAIIAKSVSDYANYEQQIGGVETLLKKSASAVQKNANNAYKTAGLSANAYMETVTSFSASLLQSLGGDTDKAAKYADLAITDMSDNANKMGTSMESIQYAYQGFAKQNYTIKSNSRAA